MDLFAKKGYEATSIEEITATVGVAKGTLYYHFSSKEEIFNFLTVEGMKLLKNSVEIKTSKLENSIDKLKAIILIQIKILVKYQNFITILFSQIWGTEERSKVFRESVYEYINMIKVIVQEGMEKGEIIKGSSEIAASSIFGLGASGLIYRLKTEEEIDIAKVYNEIQRFIINGLES